MEQRSTMTIQATPQTDTGPGESADLLANVRSIAECIKEWAALRGGTVSVLPVPIDPQTEASDISTTIH